MRCEEVREIVEETSLGGLPARIQEHLARCVACQGYAREWQMARAGFRLLAQEPVPEASLGFTARLLRRWEEAAEVSRSPVEFLEHVGRRFVYGTFFLTLVLVAALLLPSSGPLRGPTTADLYLAQAETSMLDSDPILGDASQDDQAGAPVNPASRGEETRK